MIKEISLLLLLDYSGSMEQTFEGKVKIEMMRSNLKGIIETTGNESNIGTVIYGSNPQLGCNDFQESYGSSKQITTLIKNTAPGPFGKTPLATGLKKVTSLATKTNIKQIITLTDGGDSCGLDPCKALIESDLELGKVGKSISLMLIAFDLKDEKSKLQCIKDLKLKNIKTSLVDANNEEQIYQGLLDAQKNSLGLDQNISNETDGTPPPEFDQQNQQQKDKVNAPNRNNADSRESGDSKKKSSSSQKPIRPPKELIEKDEGIIEITGAPAEAAFEVSGKNINRTWHGAFAMTLKSGIYNIRFIDQYGATIPVTLEAGDIKRIPWASLMKNAISSLKVDNPVLSVKLTPGEKTQKIHGAIPSATIDGKIDSSKSLEAMMPFGDWKMDVVNPIWLKDSIPSENITVYRGQNANTDIQSLFNKHLKWMINPYPGQMSVLELTMENKNPENFLIAPGQLNIPIPKKAKARFLIAK